jgi:hypothetical protein
LIPCFGFGDGNHLVSFLLMITWWVFNNMFKAQCWSCASVFFWAASTHDQEVFSFYPENRPCNGFEEALDRYREIVPTLRLAGLFSEDLI